MIVFSQRGSISITPLPSTPLLPLRRLSAGASTRPPDPDFARARAARASSATGGRCPRLKKRAVGADEPFCCSSRATSASQRPRLPPTRARPRIVPPRDATGPSRRLRAQFLRGELRTPPVRRRPARERRVRSPGAPGGRAAFSAPVFPAPRPSPARIPRPISRVTSFCGRDSAPPAAPPRALRSRGALPGTDRRPAARSPRPSPLRSCHARAAPPLLQPDLHAAVAAPVRPA